MGVGSPPAAPRQSDVKSRGAIGRSQHLLQPPMLVVFLRQQGALKQTRPCVQRRSSHEEHQMKTCVGVPWCFLLDVGVPGPGPSPPPLWLSLSLCRRSVCLVLLYSREKLLMVLQKSSALMFLTVALE